MNLTARLATVDSTNRYCPLIGEAQAAGATSLYAIAEALNARKVPTASGRRFWQASQVRRVLLRLQA
jgi:Recombinase